MNAFITPGQHGHVRLFNLDLFFLLSLGFFLSILIGPVFATDQDHWNASFVVSTLDNKNQQLLQKRREK